MRHTASVRRDTLLRVMNIDAAFARRWFEDALASIERAQESINSLNVFPVPDGDTGTNVLSTLRAGARAAKVLPEDAPIGTFARTFADGALWGARGNSGIIIAQSFQAVASAFEGSEEVGPVVLVRAFDAIALGARRALAEPVEGTIVTVAQDVADAVLKLPHTLTVRTVVETAVAAATESLGRTTELLPALRGTGQVDAGALCFVLLITALARAAGVPADEPPAWFVAGAHASMSDEDLSDFEVMYLVRASHREATLLRTRLNEIGNSVVVVGGMDSLWHVHVHLRHPAEALSELPMNQVCVRTLEPGRRSIVAATSAPHLLESLAAAGAVAVLNARTDTFLRAVQDANSAAVTILPCSEESAGHAQAAADRSREEGISVRVGNTRDDLAVYEDTVAYAVGAEPDADPARQVIEIDGAGPAEVNTAVAQAAASLANTRPGVVTVLVGSAYHAHRAARHLTALLQAGSPQTETYVIPGGQASPTLLVSAL